ncbi:MAG: hypothetical protein U0166_19055 [Acidobacteriota bacterium]
MRTFASACVLLGSFSLAFTPAFADEPRGAAPSEISGTVGTVDAKAMSLTVKDDKGMEKTIWWSSETRIARDGKPAGADAIKQGAPIVVKAIEKEGKWWAAEVSIK